MGLLREATVEQAAAKVGIFGPQGSGKTTTAMLMAIGLSKTYHNGAPIVFMDTESGSDFMVPICKAEGVKLFVVKSKAFKDMRTTLREGEEAGACVGLVDSYTHPWKELNDALKKKLNVSRLEFKHMDQLKTMWQQWTDQMLNSPLHTILCGRLGYVWDHEENEQGKKELVKLGSKMKSESDAGYEPSLLVEMEGIQTEALRVKKTRAKNGTIVHHAYVLKDRWRSLNGKTLMFKDLNGYKAGDYRKVFDAFRPHFDQLAIGTATQRSVDSSRSSDAMFDGAGDNAYQQRVRRVHIVLEEIDGTLTAIWPGSDAKSKALKALTIEVLFNTRSWTAVESAPLEILDSRLAALRLFEEGVKNGSQAAALTDPALASGFLVMCKEQIIAEGQQAEVGAVL
jgi:energy-coupling factor transporter ATP-binding protein EcfA2